ncbi:MAG: methyltransferase [Chloroflexota bacterium]
MTFLPEFKLGLASGWLFFVAYLVVFGLTISRFKTAVRARLYDRSLWTKQQQTVTAMGKVFSVVNMVLFVFSPIHFDSPLFVLGVGLWAAGLLGLVTALLNYNATPLDIPVTTGIYKLSRNPQIFTIWVIFLGICFIIGSGLSLLLLAVSAGLLHTAVLAEEAACLKQYGNSYQAYVAAVPRYFLVF